MDLFNEKNLHQLVNQVSMEFFNKPFMHTVVFNSRLRTTGGRYIPSEKVIELNPKYYTEMDWEEFIGIIKHELCHYHLHVEGKGYQHRDREFKELLKRTGAPRFCKPLPSERNKKTYIYRCGSCGMEYIRKRRFNVNRYRCGACGGKIIYLS